MEFLDQFFKGQILMVVSFDGSFADPAQQFTECWMRGKVGAQDKGVDEETDQVLRLQTISPGDGHSHNDIVLAGQPVEQRFEGSQ